MTYGSRSRNRLLVLLASGLVSMAANAAYFVGTISALEVWGNGNVAFTLIGVAGPCNGQFILNASSPGTKNLYAALLAAKMAGKQVTVYQTVCVAAEGYGSSYGQVDYLYPQD